MSYLKILEQEKILGLTGFLEEVFTKWIMAEMKMEDNKCADVTQNSILLFLEQQLQTAHLYLVKLVSTIMENHRKFGKAVLETVYQEETQSR